MVPVKVYLVFVGWRVRTPAKLVDADLKVPMLASLEFADWKAQKPVR